MKDNDQESIVWLTQIPHRVERDSTGNYARDKDGKTRIVPSVDIKPLAEHGRVEIMMPPMTSFFATGDLIVSLRSKLRDYNYDRGDCVCCLGDPAIIAVTGSVLSEITRTYTLLIWDRLIKRYVKIKIAL